MLIFQARTLHVSSARAALVQGTALWSWQAGHARPPSLTVPERTDELKVAPCDVDLTGRFGGLAPDGGLGAYSGDLTIAVGCGADIVSAGCPDCDLVGVERNRWR